MKQNYLNLRSSIPLFSTLVVIPCVFFGSFTPSWFPTLLPVVFALIYMKFQDVILPPLFILIVSLLINYKLNIEKRYVILAIGAVAWECILLSIGFKMFNAILFFVLLLVHLILARIGYRLTAGKKNR